jgi:glycosyltransferase involved in cell wall biosynthesis
MVLKVITFFIAAVLQCTYAWQLLYYRRTRRKNNSAPSFPIPNLSVVIPFRNEIHNLPTLLSSLKQLPISIHVHWINDHSHDGGDAWIAAHLPANHRLIQNLGEGKKQALQTGIQSIPDDHWILTLDADVQLSEDWWKTIQSHFNPNHAMIVFPIKMKGGKSWVEKFQCMEFDFFQSITAGSILRQRAQLSNGAHLAFQKKYFIMAEGYQGHQHISSGDDQFLLAAFRKKGLNIGWGEIPTPVIGITPLSDWHSLLSQRVRWAGKSTALQMSDMKLLAFNTALSNTIVIYAYLNLFLFPYDAFSFMHMVIILVKWVAEWAVFRPVSLNKWFITLLFLIIYPIWVFAVGLSVLFLKQEWKGRPLKH